MKIEMTPEEFAELIEKLIDTGEPPVLKVEDLDEEELKAQMI